MVITRYELSNRSAQGVLAEEYPATGGCEQGSLNGAGWQENQLANAHEAVWKNILHVAPQELRCPRES